MVLSSHDIIPVASGVYFAWRDYLRVEKHPAIYVTLFWLEGQLIQDEL